MNLLALLLAGITAAGSAGGGSPVESSTNRTRATIIDTGAAPVEPPTPADVPNVRATIIDTGER